MIERQIPLPVWIGLALQNKLPAAIVMYLASLWRASFLDLQRAFAPYLPVWGNKAILAGENVCIGWGLSDVLLLPLQQLLTAELVRLVPCSPHVYGAYIELPKMPILRGFPDKPPKSPTWLPTLLVAVPGAEAKVSSLVVPPETGLLLPKGFRKC